MTTCDPVSLHNRSTESGITDKCLCLASVNFDLTLQALNQTTHTEQVMFTFELANKFTIWYKQQFSVYAGSVVFELSVVHSN
jgi:hypothetical protein